jgi:hypothetical protein
VEPTRQSTLLVAAAIVVPHKTPSRHTAMIMDLIVDRTVSKCISIGVPPIMHRAEATFLTPGALHNIKLRRLR